MRSLGSRFSHSFKSKFLSKTIAKQFALGTALSLATSLGVAASLDATIDLNQNNLAPAALPDIDASVPAALKKQLSDDLKFLGELNGGATSETFYEIFDLNNFDGVRLVDFFNVRVRKVILDSDPKDPSLIAYVKTNGDPSALHLKASYTTFDMPQVFRLSILLHESRHTELADGFWLHQDCPTPFQNDDGHDITGILSGEKLEGRPACDWSSYGAYGAQATFLKHVEKTCESCNEKMKLDARLYSEEPLQRILNPEMQDALRNEN